MKTLEVIIYILIVVLGTLRVIFHIKIPYFLPTFTLMFLILGLLYFRNYKKNK
jgi:hypothetical protein